MRTGWNGAAAPLQERFDDAVLPVVCDVRDEAAVACDASSGCIGDFGGLDILVNNAGQGRVSTFADTDDDAWRDEFDLKFFSVIRPTRAFLPALKESGCRQHRGGQFPARAPAGAAHGLHRGPARRRPEPGQVDERQSSRPRGCGSTPSCSG